ncbi:MAG: TPM domain-containing protein, partial [Saprospiraceae bacterium]
MSQKFFTVEEQTRIADAIQKAESNTSGEIKVYVNTKAASGDVVKDTALLFQKLGLDKTKHRNCVLITLAT